MNNILAIMATLSEDEKQDYLLQAKRKTRRPDAKNQKLFKLLASGKTQNLDVLLYKKPAKNAYHALCKRLYDSLIDYVANKSFSNETSEELYILKLVLVSRIFFEQKQAKLAFKTLSKAEKIAKLTDLYPILNEIYHTKIQYAHLNPKLELHAVIAESEENLRFFHQELQLNQTYAVIKARQKKEGIVTYEEIKAAFSRFNIEIDEMLTYKSLFQLMEITAVAAKLQRNFYVVSPHMINIYQVVSKKDTLSDKHRYYHIMILNLMAITNFRNKQFAEALHFVDAMELEMRKDTNKYFRRFSKKLTIVQALIKNYTGKPEEALSILMSFKGNSLDIELLSIMCLFQQSNFSEAYALFKRFNHSDDWYEKKMDWIWVLKKNIIEILLMIELDMLDLVLLRLERFKRKFTKQLKQIGEERVLVFIALVEQYYRNPQKVTSKSFSEKVENSFDWLGKAQEDIFVMSFYAWLKAKMRDENLYTATLQLVGRY